jgi:hypothetical protein
VARFKKGMTPWNKGLRGVKFGGHNGLFGEANGNYKGGTLTKNGYTLISVNGKRVYKHRYIMEQHLGRKLKTWEHVHHINYDKTDNNIDNLQILDRWSHGLESANKRWHYGV